MRKSIKMLIAFLIAFAALIVIGLVSPKNGEGAPSTSPKPLYELKVDRVYIYIEEGSKYVVLDVGARYNGEESWTVWMSGFRLATDKGNAYSASSVPFSISTCFKNIPIISVKASRYGYTMFQIAFRVLADENPAELIYDAFGVKASTTIPKDINMLYVVYYTSMDVRLEVVGRRVNPFDIYYSYEPRIFGQCYIGGSVFSVSVDIGVYGFSNVDSVYLKDVKVQGAEMVEVSPNLPVELAKGGRTTINLTIKVPNYPYRGMLRIAIAVE